MKGLSEKLAFFLWLLFAAISLGGLAVVLAAPLCMAYGDSWILWFGVMVKLSLMPFCHQIPSRCFHIAGVPMPLCTRCFGLICGAALSCLMKLKWKRTGIARLRRLILSAVILMLVDWVLNVLGCYKLDWMRWGTGVYLGAVTGLVILQGIDDIRTAGSV